MDFAAATGQASQSWLVVVVALFTTSLATYWLALPRPVPGIPRNELSSSRLLGDIPALLSHTRNDNGTFVTYAIDTVQRLHEPLVQLFLKPLGRPVVLLADPREAHDIMVRRKEFDRAASTGDVARALAPAHHVHLKTGAAWRAQRRLIQDLVSPSFLHDVAGPIMHQSATVLIELWRKKCRIAGPRPWSVKSDLSHVSLDAVMGFSFGEEFGHSATKSQLEILETMDETGPKLSKGSDGMDKPFLFPTQELDDILKAMLNVAKIIRDIQSGALPILKRLPVLWRSENRRLTKVKEDFIVEQLRRAELTVDQAPAKSAVDHMIRQEKSLAETEQREPTVTSRVMIDELFGFVIAGHDTTATTICWALKYLADNHSVQDTLRSEIQQAFAAAKVEARCPSMREIVDCRIPYLSAVMEEVLRCCGTGVIVDREALIDTEVLGHRVPKGTVITCLITGPGLTSPPIEPAMRPVHVERNVDMKTWDAEDIGAFRPERWLVQRGTETAEFDAGAGPQMAFGLGARQCYGKRMAILEFRIILILVLWSFELLPCPVDLSGYDADIAMTNKPKACYVRLREIGLSGV